MRALLVLLSTVIVSNGSSLQVDGIPVHGKVHAVSVADIRDAIEAVSDASKVTVLNADRMHVFLKPGDLGWIIVERLHFAKRPTGSMFPRWGCNGRGVDDPEISQLIRTADELYVFPVLNPLKPHRDDKHLRALDTEARRALVRLLADHRNWYQGGYHMIVAGPEPRNIGLLFRSARRELILFFSNSFTSYSGHVQGALNGQHVQDMLEDNPGKKMDKWTRRFAPQELVPAE
jgi:hypothetical protein